MNDQVEFSGVIRVITRWEDEPLVVMIMPDGNELELELEEAAVLTYQMQLALKDITE